MPAPPAIPIRAPANYVREHGQPIAVHTSTYEEYAQRYRIPLRARGAAKSVAQLSREIRAYESRHLPADPLLIHYV